MRFVIQAVAQSLSSGSFDDSSPSRFVFKPYLSAGLSNHLSLPGGQVAKLHHSLPSFHQYLQGGMILHEPDNKPARMLHHPSR